MPRGVCRGQCVSQLVTGADTLLWIRHHTCKNFIFPQSAVADGNDIYCLKFEFGACVRIWWWAPLADLDSREIQKRVPGNEVSCLRFCTLLRHRRLLGLKTILISKVIYSNAKKDYDMVHLEV